MGYSSKGKRPSEYASKSAHSKVIQDEEVVKYLERCHLPKSAEEVELPEQLIVELDTSIESPIKHVIAIDGGYTDISVKKSFPSSTLAFFQFGALAFKLNDLEELGQKPFIDPSDMARLKDIERFKFILPTKNIALGDELTLTNTVRRSVYEFFTAEPRTESRKLIETLKWFLFEEYSRSPIALWELSSCPSCGERVKIGSTHIKADFTLACSHCSEKLYLTDVFRLHEAVDNELGASGILGYVTKLLEQFILIYILRSLVRDNPSSLKQVLFIIDGPLAFFGQTANMHRPMQRLIEYLFDNHELHLAGLEKSGAFVEHADEIMRRLKPNSVLLLDNTYIHKYIVPGKADPTKTYGRSTYFGNKVIFKSGDDRTYVVTLAGKEVLEAPTERDIRNLHVILQNISLLKCDMYDSSLLPVSLANKLVSLANHPSSVILEKFSKEKVH